MLEVRDRMIILTHNFENMYDWLYERGLVWRRQRGGRRCSLLNCAGNGEEMIFDVDSSRVGGGRFIC
jgi:hypothetical protein